MFEKPQSEHKWFNQLLGDWNVEAECKMGPEQPPVNMKSQKKCTTVGDMWFVAEGEGVCPETGPWKTIMTLGYNPSQKQYNGTFIASMMSHLWLYSGSMDDTGKKLILDSEGPKCESPGMAQYKDIIEVIDENHWVLSSEILDDNGTWQQIMTAHHRKI